jgi:CubicO group peptidase (beta-lactamase class C family)
MEVSRRAVLMTVMAFAGVLLTAGAARAIDATAIETDLAITIDGVEKRVGIDEALRLIKVPSASIAVIDRGEIAFARAFGAGVKPATLYQAASLSKFVSAVGAMRLVEEDKLMLDEDVNNRLTSWRVPANDFDATLKVTLRGLLSMTAGVGVPGFIGYDPGAALPTLTEILNGTPPANSPPVTVVAVPGSAYHYSGGGYEITEALMQDVAGEPFTELMRDLVLGPAGMTASSFAS